MMVGVISGAALFLHAQLQPLDIVERYLETPLTSIVLYGVCGILLGTLFAIALRNKPGDIRRKIYLAVPCLITSIFANILFLVVTLGHVVGTESREGIIAVIGTGSTEAMIAFDFLLMFVCCLVADYWVGSYQRARVYVGLKTIFRFRLIASLVLGFLAASGAGFAVITVHESSQARNAILGELHYLENQFNRLYGSMESVLNQPELASLPADAQQKIVGDFDFEGILDGYDINDGTALIIVDGKVDYSYNSAYEVGDSIEKIFGIPDSSILSELSKSDNVRMMLYRDEDKTIQLSYTGAVKLQNTEEEAYLTFAKPFSMVFANRSILMLFTSLITLLLLVIVYVVVDRILKVVVVDPINNANRSLEKITNGDLDQMVSEVGSNEFASLSIGINTTVDALKGWIDEANRRMERELATARAIQEGSLPRTFPAFPKCETVDLFATMDAAKEVGGDFYDYFEIDDTTVGFLIADVSGKGVPASLFMMSAKTEIQNHLSTGVEPAQAIARANAYLCAHNEAQMFVTVWAATLDCSTGKLCYVNAGHNFPLLRHGRNGSWEWLKKRCGLFLGTFEVARYKQETIFLEPGDELVLYTDGVNEAFSIDDEEFGNDRLERFLALHADLRPQEMVRGLRAEVAQWAEGAEQSDDVTILVVEYDVSDA